MAKEEEKHASNEDEKLDIEDIKDPLDELDNKEGDLDIEEAVSEEEPASIEVKKEAEKPEPKEKKQATKSKKGFFKKKDKKEKEKPAAPEKNAEETLIVVEKPKKKNIWPSVLLVLLTVLITAAAVLGVVWYINRDNQPLENEEVVATPQKQEVTKDRYVYVNSSVGINLRSEPITTSEILAIIPNGTKLKVLDENEGWYKVEYQGKEGWVSKEFVTEKEPGKYTNPDYGFSLTFPATWTGYKLVKKTMEDGSIVYYVGLPTTDTNWTDPSGEAGFGSFFAIDVYTKAQWTAVSGGEDPQKPTKLAEKGNYVFALSPGQATPSDLSARYDDIKSIIGTFSAE